MHRWVYHATVTETCLLQAKKGPVFQRLGKLQTGKDQDEESEKEERPRVTEITAFKQDCSW